MRESDNMRIIVLGAGGFVGGWIAEVLAEMKDIVPLACLRQWASAVRVARRGIPIAIAGCEETIANPSLLDGADVLINASMPPPSQESELVSSLHSACAKAGVRRFIQFSSAAVYGNATGEVSERTPTAPIDDYSRGKVAMEQRLSQVAAGTQTATFIFRPSIIYGPFSEAWSVRYARRVVSGRWRSLGRVGNGFCNLVHAHDVARAAIRAATSDIGPGVYLLNLNGPDRVTWNEYIERLGDALAIPGRVIPNELVFRGRVMAAELMRVAARLGTIRSFYKRSTGNARAAIKNAQGFTRLYPSRVELDLLGRRVYYSASQAAELLGIRPSIDLDAGLRQSATWCRVHGLVSTPPA